MHATEQGGEEPSLEGRRVAHVAVPRVADVRNRTADRARDEGRAQTGLLVVARTAPADVGDERGGRVGQAPGVGDREHGSQPAARPHDAALVAVAAHHHQVRRARQHPSTRVEQPDDTLRRDVVDGAGPAVRRRQIRIVLVQSVYQRDARRGLTQLPADRLLVRHSSVGQGIVQDEVVRAQLGGVGCRGVDGDPARGHGGP